jgi:hypothetical protein
MGCYCNKRLLTWALMITFNIFVFSIQSCCLKMNTTYYENNGCVPVVKEFFNGLSSFVRKLY